MLNENNIQHDFAENKYKIKFEFEFPQDEYKLDKRIDVQISITKVDEVTCAIEFRRISGN